MVLAMWSYTLWCGVCVSIHMREGETYNTPPKKQPGNNITYPRVHILYLDGHELVLPVRLHLL